MINSHQIWTALLSYPPSGKFCFYLLKIGAKFFGDESQDICKDTESNLGPFAGFKEPSFISFRFVAERRAVNKCQLVLRSSLFVASFSFLTPALRPFFV